MEMCQMVGIDDGILTSLPRQLTNTYIQKVKIATALLKEADAYLYVVVVDEEVNMVAHISKYIFKLDGTPNQIGHLKPFP
ncbi:hypothetical protein YC2023_059164 [Brassica napus]